MDRLARLGHVSKDRLLGEGSAFARQLARAREEQQQQQQLLQQALQQGHDTDQDTELEDEEQEAPQLTWSELWDARTVSGYVGAAMRTDESRQLQLQLWWPPEKPKRTSNAPDVHFLRYSSVRARALQRQQQQQMAPEQDASAAAYRRVTDLLFGPQSRATSRQPQQHGRGAAAGIDSDASCDWVCCNRPLPLGTATSSEPALGSAVCGAVNPAASVRCIECGAARWDGPGGQLQAQLRAALQTADLDTTTLKQVMRRIAAESSSSAGVGLQLPVAAVKAELAAFLAERSTSKPAAAAAQDKPTTAMYGRGDSCTAGHAGPDSFDVHVLPPGCPAAAASVYTSLLACLQHMPEQQHSSGHQQQQQQQQPGSVAASVRVHAAAVAATLLAPRLMHGVFRRQNKLPEIIPVPGAIRAWVGDMFDATAAAAAAGCSGPTKLQVQAVSRPLPDCTVHQLLNRRCAALQQRLQDTAQGYPAAATGGGSSSITFNSLPVVTRSFEDVTGDVLMTEQVPPREWLAHNWSRNTARKCRMPAQAFRVGNGREQRGSAGSDIIVTELIECDDWNAVVAVRQHVQHILATWCGGSECSQRQQQQQQQQQQRRRLPGPRTLLDKHSEIRLQDRILKQRSHVLHAWGSAPQFGLRHVLNSTCKPQHKHQRQRQTARSEDHLGGRTSAVARRKQQQQQQQRWEKKGGAALTTDGPSAAGGVRHRKSSQQTAEAALAGDTATAVGQPQQQQQQGQQQEQPVKQRRKRSREQEPQPSAAAADVNALQPSQCLTRTAGSGSNAGGTAAAAPAKATATSQQAADGTSSSSSSSSGSSSGDGSGDDDDQISSQSPGSNTSDSEWVDSDAEGRMARARQAKRIASATGKVAADQSDSSGDMDRMFDMMLASVDDLMLELQAAPHSGAFRPRPGGAWQAADTHQGQQSRASQSWPTHMAHGGANLPAGMQVVLQQAASMGISAGVLQRTVAKLDALVSRQEQADIAY